MHPKLQAIKAQCIELIKEAVAKGHTVCHRRSEADGFWDVTVHPDRSRLELHGYARENLSEDVQLDGIELKDLAALAENAARRLAR